MAQSAVDIARELLEAGPDGMEALIVLDLDDETSHDDAALGKAYDRVTREFAKASAALTQVFGPASRTGREDDDLIPLNGVLRFAIWSRDEAELYLAASHEDRGVPILLMLGTAEAI